MTLTLEDLRPEVKWFAVLMEETLRKHDKSKGGTTGWRKCDGDWLYEKLLQEAQELENELNPLGGTSVASAKVIAEAVDVANYAMMIADNHRDPERYIESVGGS